MDYGHREVPEVNANFKYDANYNKYQMVEEFREELYNMITGMPEAEEILYSFQKEDSGEITKFTCDTFINKLIDNIILIVEKVFK